MNADKAIGGIGNSSAEAQGAAFDMAEYEQLVTASPGFAQLAAVETLSTTLLSSFAINAVPFASSYGDLAGDVTNDNDKWNWVQNSILPAWNNMDPNDLANYVIYASNNFWTAVSDRDSDGGFA